MASFCLDTGGCGQVPGGGALGWLVLGKLWKGACVSVRRLFHFLSKDVLYRMSSPSLSQRFHKDYTSIPYRCQEQQPRSGTAVPSLLDDLEHENAIPGTCVPLCAKRRAN